jgi:DNA-binding NarL/FixJ family response regulator
MKHTRVLLADDHPLTLEGLRAFLAPHLEAVVATVAGHWSTRRFA